MALKPTQRARARWSRTSPDGKDFDVIPQSVDAVGAERYAREYGQGKLWKKLQDIILISGGIGMAIGMIIRTSGIERVLDETNMIEHVGERTRETIEAISEMENKDWAHIWASLSISGAIGAGVGEGVGLSGYALWSMIQARRSRKKRDLRVVDDE